MQTKNKILLSGAALALAAGGYMLFKKENYAPLPTESYVNLEKYTGRWYEIARLPFREESGCSNTSAEYSLAEDGTIRVLNKCLKSGGEIEQVEGKAKVVDTRTNSKLKVQFFWPFSGDYWILRVDEEYRHALVGTPDRKYLWLLSRTPQLDGEIIKNLLGYAQGLGYDTKKIIFTKHDEAAASGAGT